MSSPHGHRGKDDGMWAVEPWHFVLLFCWICTAEGLVIDVKSINTSIFVVRVTPIFQGATSK